MSNMYAYGAQSEAADASPRKFMFVGRFQQSIWNTCPLTGVAAQFLTSALVVIAGWAALFCFTDAGSFMRPDGLGFALVITVVIGLIVGEIVQLVRLPGLLGMLITGIMLRNLPGVEIGENLMTKDPWFWYAGKLRTLALMVILTRAGLGLDPEALKRLSFVVIRLAFTPCLVETCVVAIASHFLLSFPWTYSFMLGFILAAVSPAVVVPCLLSLQESGYGVDKGIPTLVIAAASIDDVLAISGFGLVFGITFSQGGLAMQIVGGPLQAVLGIVWGLVIGCVLWYFPAKDSTNLPFLRCSLLVLAGMVALFGSPLINFHGFGALATLSAAFMAGYGWKSDKSDKDVSEIFSNLWYIFQPLLFGLIGVAIDITRLKVETVAYGLLTLACGLGFRCIATFLVVSGAGLSWKERLFVGLAWLPKATVQAALASVVLDHAMNTGLDKEVVDWGTDILTVAVLVILVTAPVGAVAIMLSAPRLLNRSQSDSLEPDVNGIEQVPTQSVILRPDDIELDTKH